jgi:hypothetical protein
MTGPQQNGSAAPLLAPIAGILASVTLIIVAIVVPEHRFAGPILTGAVAGGIASLALLGVAARRQPTASPSSPSTIDAQDLATRLARIDEHVMLSDASKRLLYRDRELDLVRMMLERDIAAGDHDAALRLVDELGTQFGRLEEAEGHRARIGSIREAEVRDRLASGMQVIRRHLANGDWSAATAEADRLHRLLPDAPGLDGLANQIASARARHAADIEARMRDAHADGRIDEAMRLLRELDRHLVSDEASRVVDVAQAIIVAHRDLAGRRFRDAVSEKQWPVALELGESIVRDYPNTRMAEETTALLPGIRSRLNHG